MSRAFTKEIDDAPPPPLPERLVSSERNLVTPTGARMIEGSIASINERIARASDQKDVHALNRELKYWQARKATMEIIDYPQGFDFVRFGLSVRITRDGKSVELEIVGEDEADPQTGKIAWTSPLARAIDGASVGDEADFKLPRGWEKIKIEHIGACSGSI